MPTSRWATCLPSSAMRPRHIRRRQRSSTDAVRLLKQFMAAAFALALMGMDAPVEYSIEAIRYGISPGVPVSALVVDGPKDEKVDVDFVIWLIRGSGRNLLF